MRFSITLFFTVIIFFFSCSHSSEGEMILSDCESIQDGKIMGYSTSARFSDRYFEDARSLSSDYSRSGKRSVRLSRENPYGMTYIIQKPMEGEHFRISVWRLKADSGGCLVVSGSEIEELYLVQHRSEEVINNWEKLVIDLVVPATVEMLKVYVWNADVPKPVYFDDLKIEYLSNNSGTLNPVDSFIDKRDGQTYKTVKIGDAWWMAENLNFNLNGESFCYGNSDLNCETDGRLYNFYSAQKAVPEGWTIPTDDDWKKLEAFIGMSKSEIELYGNRGVSESMKLRKFGSSGMNVKLAGIYSINFYFKDRTACFWTSTEIDPQFAYIREINHRLDIGRFKDKKDSMYFSVRCIKK